MTGIDELIGKTVGGYVIQERIGKGGMSTVYRALQTSMNRIVALKILPRELMVDDAYMARFKREVDIVAQLEHRNIVPVYDHGDNEGQPFIAMRYMGAGSLDRLLGDGPLDIRRIVSVYNQIAPALDYAHNKNVLHRDLKPSNVLMDDNDGFYLTDFGIARILGVEGQGSTITTQGVVGTPSYMSPEQAQGHPMDGRSDVYALGVMLFEMATGRRPFISDTPYSIAVMQVTAEPPSARSLNPKITPSVEKVIIKAMKKNPDDRYQTAQSLAQALQLAVDSPGTSMLDTQPRPIDVRSLNVTQPHAPQSPSVPLSSVPQQSAPQSHAPQSSAPQLAAGNSYGPPSPPPNYYQPPVSPPSRQMPPISRQQSRARRLPRRGTNMWLSMSIGALIGCGLLAIFVVVLIMILQALFGEAATPAPTPDGVPQAVQNTLSSTRTSAMFSTNTPTNVPTLSPNSGTQVALASNERLPSLENASALFFAERQTGEDEPLTFELYQYRFSDGITRQLTNVLSNEQYATVSPDGMRIVFQSDSDGDFDLYLMEASNEIEATSPEITLDATRLFNSIVDELYPAWSPEGTPDGDWIVFSADTRGDGSLDLFMVRPNGTDLRRVYTNGQRNSHPRWSPDGTMIVFTTGRADDAQTWDIAVLDVASGDVTRVVNDDIRQAWPVFSADGSEIYFVDGTGNDTRIARVSTGSVSADRADIDEIHGRDDYIWGLTLTPDGRHLVFTAGGVSDAQGVVYALAVDGPSRTRQRLGLEAGIIVAWMQ